MRKLLFLIPTYSSYYHPIKNTFQSLDWKVRTIDYRRGDLPIRILRFMPYFGGQVKASRQIETMILKSVNSYNPDLILTVKGESLNGLLLKKNKDKNCKLVNWFPDPINHWGLIKRITPCYDLFFHFDPLVLRKLKKIGFKNVYYLPFASEVTDLNSKKKTFDISFVGTYSPFREKYLSYLSRFDLNIWGDQRWYQSKLKKFVRGGRITQGKMKNVIMKSKININLHGFRPTEGTNLRTFEVTGCGGFLLTESVKDLARLFKLDKEIVTFTTPRELIEKSAFYLLNDYQRIGIAKAGYKRAQAKHSYKKRIKELLMFV